MKNSIRNKIPKFLKDFIKKYVRAVFLIIFKVFLKQEDLLPLSKHVKFSGSDNKWAYEGNDGVGGVFRCSNHSGGYHGLLKQWWEFHGLGKKVLLISESKKVGMEFAIKYPKVLFKTCDYFLEVKNGSVETDFLWNMYEDPPSEMLLNGKFDAIVCQATFEHLMDPVGVLKRLTQLLSVNGFLYLHTHTPLYPYHACPRDYIRFHPDWFTDITQLVVSLKLKEMHAESGHVFACYTKRMS